MQELPLSERQRLCQLAIDSAIQVGLQINGLLDAIEEALARPRSGARDLFEVKEVQVSLNELAKLPKEIELWISDLRNGRERVVSDFGFRTYVIDELVLHVNSLLLYLSRKNIEVSSENFSVQRFSEILGTLKQVSIAFG